MDIEKDQPTFVRYLNMPSWGLPCGHAVVLKRLAHDPHCVSLCGYDAGKLRASLVTFGLAVSNVKEEARPPAWRSCVDQVQAALDVSERRMPRVLGQHQSTQLKVPCEADDEQLLTENIIALVKQYGRYGYHRVTALLHAAGWSVNPKRVKRI